MKRWVLNIFAVLSLVLFLMVCALWVRSHFAEERLSWSGGGWFAIADGWKGRLDLIAGKTPTTTSVFLRTTTAPPPMRPYMTTLLRLIAVEDYRVALDAASQANQPPPSSLAQSRQFISLKGYGIYRWAGLASGRSHTGVALPLWLPASIFALAPVAVMVEWMRRHRRVRRCLCPSCGYDLRMTPDRCPECGLSVGDEQ